LPFIWNAHSDRSNAARRDAALEIFHSMRTEVIKDELVSLLVSHKRDDIAMAVSLLLERIHDESVKEYADHVMVPELIDYVQTHTTEDTNLRIIALLLLLGEETIADHLVQGLDESAQQRKQLLYSLLLLGKKTHELLLEVFLDADTSAEMRSDCAAILSMVMATNDVIDYARNISKYGLSSSRSSVLFPDQLAISLRALGGLLASGQWNARKLQEMRDDCKADDPARELFNVLLGWLYEPQIAQLESEMEAQRDTFKKELLTVTSRAISEQKRAQELEEELEKLREEHGMRGDELKQAHKEKDALRANVDQLTKDKTSLRTTIDQITKEKIALNAQLERTKQEYQTLVKQQNPLKLQQPNNTQIR
jgi:hypothetical protein